MNEFVTWVIRGNLDENKYIENVKKKMHNKSAPIVSYRD